MILSPEGRPPDERDARGETNARNSREGRRAPDRAWLHCRSNTTYPIELLFSSPQHPPGRLSVTGQGWSGLRNHKPHCLRGFPVTIVESRRLSPRSGAGADRQITACFARRRETPNPGVGKRRFRLVGS
ncbi:hypothetical protein FQA47_000693 [Oryzias melastigma]|uniref:Uncharacterized protein n=1 Tax=Oryzias melastigma TaxID=30732 RepID=A0A834F7K5_ORYME|nr:hypothetical protein FQA47_021150 [Oryzias melastigma]KAF6724311.1 hypothetical protein FQA47_000693 [Oryzias melastigma]